MIIVLGIIIISLFIAGLILPMFTSYSSEVFNQFIIASGNETPSNLSSAAETSFQPAIETLGIFQTLLLIAFIFFFIGFIVLCAFVRAYPFLIIIWIIGIILLAGISIFLSITYTDIKSTNAETRQVYGSWAMTDFFMSNLPIIVVVIGVIGGLIMLMIIPKDQEIEVGGFESL